MLGFADIKSDLSEPARERTEGNQYFQCVLHSLFIDPDNNSYLTDEETETQRC